MAKPRPIALPQVRILHLDPDLIVVDKPAGVSTLRRDEPLPDEQGSNRGPTLDELVLSQLPGQPRRSIRSKPRRQTPPVNPLHPVHRLDRDTSGLVLFALSSRARDALIPMMARHEVNRTYLAIAIGRVDAPQTIVTHIARDRGDGVRGSVSAGSDSSAERAVTHVRPVEHFADAFTLVECRLETGRTHQIRIHLAELGHPVAGEKLYNRPRVGAQPIADTSNFPRQALHACKLEFTHPTTARPMCFESPLPPDLRELTNRLGGRGVSAC